MRPEYSLPIHLICVLFARAAFDKCMINNGGKLLLRFTDSHAKL